MLSFLNCLDQNQARIKFCAYSKVYMDCAKLRALKAGLEERGWKQSNIDPCLFLKSGMMCVVYVDNTIFASASIDDLEREITSLGISTDAQRHTFALRDEGEVSAFLGILI